MTSDAMAEQATLMGDVISFGPFRLAVGERLLTRDGARVELGGRALDLLIALATHPNEPVTKRALAAAVWPDVTVGESSLRFHMTHLRKALGDGQDGARYIVTLSGRGYCFVAPLRRAAPSTPPRSPPTNLPLRPALIGRDEALAEVITLLGRERLVTIVGPGGVGKTRLAIAAGWRAAEAFPDGVWLIDLAALTDPALVVSAVATALDLARGATQLSAAVIASAIRTWRLLLILDNCEHLVDAAAELANALLEQVPGLTVLATSQENLRLDPEQVYRLGPLSLPPPDAVDITGYGAVTLFARRVAAAHGRFELSDANAADVADICRRLDGMPLSLEMAAARIPTLGLEGVRASLEARLVVLSAGLRTTDLRHQTLRNTVEWSVGLLDETEHLVFRQLGVFSGGFSLEAAMAVVGSGSTIRWTVADVLGRLVDKSLVTLENVNPARYRLLETLRLYAAELLQASGEWDRLAECHARHFCEVFAPSRGLRETTPIPAWNSVYLPELENLRSAVDWALAEPSRRDVAVELIAWSGFVWSEWGLVEEGQRVLGLVVGMVDERTAPAYAAPILLDAGSLLREHPDRSATRRLLNRSAAFFRELGDEAGLATVNLTLASHHRMIGGHSEAATVMRGVRDVLSAHGRKRTLCTAMITLGNIATDEQNFAEAIEDFNLVSGLAIELEDRRFEHLASTNLSMIEFSRGDVERAIELGRKAVSSARNVRQSYLLPPALHNVAAYLLSANRLGDARPFAEEALSRLRGQEPSPTQRTCLQMWALIAALEGKYPESARIIGWVDGAYGQSGGARARFEQQSYERLLALLSARLSDGEMEALAAEGARWSFEQAVNLTFERVVR
jgi:predicted ATPase/DNA-binding winged helix-turn-helix (wHTH) protein/Flp pilus assembly protein TadD